MSKRLLPVDREGIEATDDAPAIERIVSGHPANRTWNIEDDAGLYAGLWESTPGEWRIEYTEWEFCHLISGVSILTEDGGASKVFRGGDSFIIRPGFRGTWKVVEHTVKHYVVRLPPPSEGA